MAEQTESVEPLQVGDVLHGFTGGHFGRDSYSCKRVEALGAHWVVARDFDGEVFARVNPERLIPYRTDFTYCHEGCDGD